MKELSETLRKKTFETSVYRKKNKFSSAFTNLKVFTPMT